MTKLEKLVREKGKIRFPIMINEIEKDQDCEDVYTSFGIYTCDIDKLKELRDWLNEMLTEVGDE